MCRVLLCAMSAVVVVPIYGQEEADKKAAGDLVKRYLEVEWQKRLPFVANPDKVEGLMRETYRNARTSGIRAEILAVESDGKDAFIVSAEAMQGSSKPSNIVFTVRRTKDGLKVDWPASVGSNPTPLKTLFADFPKDAAKVPVVAELANYFNYEYRKTEDDYFSIRLKEAVPPFSCHGYISKTDEHGKSLFKLLKDGKGHRVLIEIDLIGPNNESAVETARPTF